MDNIKLEVSAGTDFSSIADQAKGWAIEHGRNVEFVFNDITCVVGPETNLEFLFRDYQNSWTMDWKTIGPDCPETYSPEVQAELETRQAARDEKYRKQAEEARIREEQEKAEFMAAIEGVELDLIDQDGWNETREKNQDPYGKAAVDYAEYWARRMQVEIAKGRTVAECADECQNGLGFMGITGFMYGCAVGILSRVWKHGADLRKWHNGVYGVTEETEGVVNPAILTF